MNISIYIYAHIDAHMCDGYMFLGILCICKGICKRICVNVYVYSCRQRDRERDIERCIYAYCARIISAFPQLNFNPGT